MQTSLVQFQFIASQGQVAPDELRRIFKSMDAYEFGGLLSALGYNATQLGSCGTMDAYGDRFADVVATIPAILGHKQEKLAPAIERTIADNARIDAIVRDVFSKQSN